MNCDINGKGCDIQGFRSGMLHNQIEIDWSLKQAENIKMRRWTGRGNSGKAVK